MSRSAIDRLRALQPGQLLDATVCRDAILELSDRYDATMRAAIAAADADERLTSSLTYRVVEPDESKSREERFAEIQTRIMREYASTFEKLANGPTIILTDDGKTRQAITGHSDNLEIRT